MSTHDAAERLRRINTECEAIGWNGIRDSIYPEAYRIGGDDQVRKAIEDDRYIVANAYLAANPADSEEEISRDWLGSVGGKLEWHPLKVTFSPGFGLWDVDDGWKVMLLHSEHAASCIVRGLKTRGDVRRLAAAIGIPLKGEA